MPTTPDNSDAVNLATADLFRAEIARLQAENERLRLTDAEREAVEYVVAEGRVASSLDRDVLHGLLERTAG